jgi:hypothetical protein
MSMSVTTRTVTQPLSASSSLAVLVLLAAGHTAAQVADITTWSRRRVVELAELRGWRHDPDTDRVAVPVPARRLIAGVAA